MAPWLVGLVAYLVLATVVVRWDMARYGERVADFGAGRFVSDTTVVDVRVADLTSPRPGDVIVIGADSHVIQGEPLRDRERLIWTLDLRPA